MKRTLYTALFLLMISFMVAQTGMAAQANIYSVILDIQNELATPNADESRIVNLFARAGYGEAASNCDGLSELEALLVKVVNETYGARTASSNTAVALESDDSVSRASTSRTCGSTCNANTGHNTQRTCSNQQTRSTCAGQCPTNTRVTCASQCGSTQTRRTCAGQSTCRTCSSQTTCRTCSSQTTCRTCSSQTTCRTCSSQTTCRTCSSQTTCRTCSVNCGSDNVNYVNHTVRDSNMNGYYEPGERVDITVTVANNGNSKTRYNVYSHLSVMNGNANVISSRVSYGKIRAYSNSNGSGRLSLRLPSNSYYSNIRLMIEVKHGSYLVTTRYIDLPIVPANQSSNRILVVVEDMGYGTAASSGTELISSLYRLGHRCDVINMATSPSITSAQLNAYKNGLVIVNLPGYRISQLAYTVQDFVNAGGRLAIMSNDAGTAYDSNPALFRTVFGSYFENRMNTYQLDGRGAMAGMNLTLTPYSGNRSIIIDNSVNNYNFSVQPLLGYAGDAYRLAGIAVENYSSGSRTALFNFEIGQLYDKDSFVSRLVSYMMPYSYRLESYREMSKNADNSDPIMLQSMFEDLAAEAVNNRENQEMLQEFGENEILNAASEYEGIERMTR